VTVTGAIEDLRKSARMILEARLFPVAVELFIDSLFVRFAGNEKGVAFQTEQALKLLKNAEIVTDDAELWKKIAAARASEDRVREEPSGTARVLMERIKRQLDPKNILAAD
jgi:hypothetical protein